MKIKRKKIFPHYRHPHSPPYHLANLFVQQLIPRYHSTQYSLGAPHQHSRTRMKKNLTAFGLLWISLTSMIGSGWLFGSLYSAHFAGPAAIIAWPLAGFLLLFVALSYAEIGTMFPQADNLAHLPFYTHGHLTSLILSGLTWL